MTARPINHYIHREVILDKAQQCLDQVDQWIELRSYSTAAKYAAQAEALLELIESDDCGSHGGFDKDRGQPPVRSTEEKSSLQVRLDWLKSIRE